MERTYEQTNSAIRELSSDELSTAELEEVAGGIIGLITVETAAASARVPEIVASVVASYHQWRNASSLGGRK
jgi:hypothetical protein